MSLRRSVRLPSALPAGRAALLIVALGAPAELRAQESRPAVTAVHAATPIELNGRLDEPAWEQAPAATDFTQREPEEGVPATQRTEVRFLFDRDALYVGARMYDSEGAAGVVSRLFRRDGDFESDFLQIVLDSFNDHLGRTMLIVNPAGVKGDQLGLGGANPDESWDPVWDVATSIDSLGWTAELRIPCSQLRFPRGADQIWGLQIYRMVHRLNELSMWSYYPATESGGPAFFGHLEGLAIEASPAKGELLPYAVARNERLGTADPNSPFYSENDLGARLGADVKYLLTSNLTLN
ncbi:MAG: carbohydrate binding family 9 domain-containing protein, partial [Gemmatimonadales bacterium]|nr:carbohydrate binding family 9 domain-containing protein [Gemmatimonadales bacterium]